MVRGNLRQLPSGEYRDGLWIANMDKLTVQVKMEMEIPRTKKCEHAGLKVTTSHGGNTTARMIKRFNVADDLNESSKITQVKGTMLKDHYLSYNDCT
ncbi:hypothetical protein Tco_0978590 [Tanacetum coccineum]|uniref:Uncharacterized protein n=1 Tax=Tanacetum coccineum TaxID=301880 RepID=A0ABQ5ENU2_9ASTR